MNERIKQIAVKAQLEHCVSHVRLQEFAELIVEECCNRMSQETIRHDGYGYNQHALYQVLREHFGVKND